MVKRSIITVKFSRIKEEDIQLYLKLKEFDKPGSIIKDILKGRLTLSILQEEQKITLFVDEDNDVSEWIITIYVYMEPEYSDIVDLEQWFTKIAEQFGGEYDGWGCMAYVYDDEEDDDENYEQGQA